MGTSPYLGTSGICIKSLITYHIRCNVFLCRAKSNVANMWMIQLYMCEKKKKKKTEVQRKLESLSLIILEWFRDNYLKANRGKFHIMLMFRAV